MAYVDDGEGGQQPPADFNQKIMELQNKNHLLSEENQILFQQIDVLRAHYDQFNKDHADRTEEANKKISKFERVKDDLQIATQQKDNFARTTAYLDQKLEEAQTRLTTAEEGRKKDQ